MATATSQEMSRLRRQLGLDSTQLPDADIKDMYTVAEEQYPAATYSRAVWFAAVRLQAAKDQMAKAAHRVTYAQGQSRDNLSDLIKNMEKMVKLYSDDLQEAIAAEVQSLPPVMWGVPKKIPTREQEWPDG